MPRSLLWFQSPSAAQGRAYPASAHRTLESVLLELTAPFSGSSLMQNPCVVHRLEHPHSLPAARLLTGPCRSSSGPLLRERISTCLRALSRALPLLLHAVSHHHSLGQRVCATRLQTCDQISNPIKITATLMKHISKNQVFVSTALLLLSDSESSSCSTSMPTTRYRSHSP